MLEAGAYSLDEVACFGGEVGREEEFCVKNLVYCPLAILSTERRLEGGGGGRSEC